MTYTKEEILNDDFDINNFYDVPFEVGSIYPDNEGFWEILDIGEDGVTIRDIEKKTVWESVDPEMVTYFCKYGLRQDLANDEEM